MAFPRTKAELEAAGYRYNNTGQCSACLRAIEWWWTPKGRKLPFDVEAEAMVPHFASCPQVSKFRKAK